MAVEYEIKTAPLFSGAVFILPVLIFVFCFALRLCRYVNAFVLIFCLFGIWLCMKDNVFIFNFIAHCSFFVTKERTKKVPRLSGFFMFASNCKNSRFTSFRHDFCSCFLVNVAKIRCRVLPSVILYRFHFLVKSTTCNVIKQKLTATLLIKK